ncbi:CynX/NimT family MFS transporter [Arthrobacter sp. Marseille-P9274]|uniref:MFS transporter n=1 Tax=Arthrobacter sp. Marseille-P9274 TaxID=2866572 RepID=UPI0021C8575C|nr:MFS transporter [Arthrobacter sp. Marseille-P9274]
MSYFIPRKPWRGRIGALLGILIMALSLRAAVSVVPPLLGTMGPELGFDAATTGALAMLPPLVFAAAGLATPALIRWQGAERVLAAAVLLAVAGQLSRAAVDSVWPFLGMSAVVMAGYGMGNVVLPPLVKKYFPDRMGVVTAGYVTLLAVGTAASPQLAVPVAELADWRVSIALWASVSALVLAPWGVQLLRDGRARDDDGGAAFAGPVAAGAGSAASAHREGATARTTQAQAPAVQHLNPWCSRVAWGLAIFLAGNSAQTYVYFTWLPPYLTGQGVDAAAAGSALAYFAILGLPVSLLVPLLVPKMRNPIIAVVIFAACWAGGHLGLYLAPTAGTWWWITLAGLGQGTFAMALLMMNLRSRTQHGAAVLAGFSQGIGYAGAGLAPLLFGVVQEATGGWTASFAMLGVCLLVLLVGAVMINPRRYIEDDGAAAGTLPEATARPAPAEGNPSTSFGEKRR